MEFFLLYLAIGFFILIVLNILFYITYNPLSKSLEILVIIILWPSVIVSFVNEYYNLED